MATHGCLRWEPRRPGRWWRWRQRQGRRNVMPVGDSQRQMAGWKTAGSRKCTAETTDSRTCVRGTRPRRWDGPALPHSSPAAAGRGGNNGGRAALGKAKVARVALRVEARVLMDKRAKPAGERQSFANLHPSAYAYDRARFQSTGAENCFKPSSPFGWEPAAGTNPLPSSSQLLSGCGVARALRCNCDARACQGGRLRPSATLVLWLEPVTPRQLVTPRSRSRIRRLIDQRFIGHFVRRIRG